MKYIKKIFGVLLAVSILAVALAKTGSVVALGRVVISTDRITMLQGETKTFQITGDNVTGRVDIVSENPEIASISDTSIWVESDSQDDKTHTITVQGDNAGSTRIIVINTDVADSTDATELEVTSAYIIVDVLAFTIDPYTYDQTNEIIDDIPEQTKVSDFRTNISVNSPFVIKVYSKDGVELADSDMVGTGSITKIINQNNGGVIKTMTNLVRGDVNGDAKISSSDYVLVKNHIMSKGTLIEIYFKAADFDKTGAVNASDYVKIKNKIMK